LQVIKLSFLVVPLSRSTRCRSDPQIEVECQRVILCRQDVESRGSTWHRGSWCKHVHIVPEDAKTHAMMPQPTLFNITLGRTYRWETASVRDQTAFLNAVVTLHRQTTRGRKLILVGFTAMPTVRNALFFAKL
jgi:hypothetical protein